MTKAEKIEVMKANGIDYPKWTYEAHEESGFGLAALCAVLEKETGGGANVYGHDKDSLGQIIWHGRPGRVDVTEANYANYKEWRDIFGLAQGVGPMQLTSPGLQSEADNLGGCWHPRHNLRIGARHLKRLQRAHGDIRTAFRAYNGSGPAAEAYADAVMVLRDKWRQLLDV